MKKKMILILASAVLMLAIGVGGTLAYLTAQSTVTNTFSIGNVALTLEETIPGTTDKTTQGVGYTHLVPSEAVTKDPVVTVGSTSEKCYLFVELIETNNPSTYLTYDIVMDDSESGWNPLTGHNNVYYRVVDPSVTNPQLSFNLINGNTVTVKEAVGSLQLPAPTAAPSIAFKASAVQFENIGDGVGDLDDALAAWGKL